MLKLKKFSLGQELLKLYNITGYNESTIAIHSFYNNTQIIPDPKGDFFSSGPSALYAQDNDILIMFTQPPDLLTWRREYMHNFKKVQVIEINPPANLIRKGYPEGSSVNSFFTLLRRDFNLMNSLKNKYVISLFPTQELNNNLEEFGFRVLQRYDSYVINNKAILHEKAHKYGIKVSRFIIAKNIDELRLAAKKFTNTRHGIWIKAEGSGADLVIYVKNITIDNILESWDIIKTKIVNFFRSCNFTKTEKLQLVDKETFFPKYGLLLEEDIREESEDFVNAAAMLSLDINGNGNCIGLYNQEPNINPFCGTNRIEFDKKLNTIMKKYGLTLKQIKKRFDQEAIKIFRFIHDYSFVGIFGIDFFFVFTDKGVDVIVTEINARITNNSGINIAAAINNHSLHHMPLSMKFPKPVNSIKELSEYVTIKGKNYLMENPEELSILPQTFNSIWLKTNLEYSLIESGYICRSVVLGKDHKKIIELTTEIHKNGVKFI
ncbi:MAG: hypothetical protein US11_C0001G0036 [Candidatus Roizmanbacteria bacterium GW2011_GWA2_36_23]|uniref:ATP-grasp domain-containing protein n=1 Tax=Candidatus Roizmanbacteria bacterium GW2011_GWA2_36_23 TaxID=1618480 RepID=A0A0G0E977_9BACT|nr:MAG: hypothetical protein US11_C0001G0036 [Candidatus Roizmanbacteria bacterium GW2011_GWA2_36_23]